MHQFFVSGKGFLLLLVFTVVGCGGSPSPENKSASDLNGVTHSVENLKSRDADARLFHAQLLGQLGSVATEAIPALESLQSDSDPRVQKAANEALRKIREDKP